ncbi:MAG: magnesium-translocating P-type ATPase [Planctomycetes bacterium]|nr:magnesium-translocating P-type ATPase [Planctomycetota bacterium]
MPESNEEPAFWSVTVDQLLDRLHSSDQGLSHADAAERLGRSRPLKARKRPAWSLLLDQFKNPIIVLLFCSAVLSFTMPDERTNAWIILVIMLGSGLLGFWQELSAADAVARLMGMIETRATVLRDGTECEIPLPAVVPGDVIRLSAGNLIPGDCRLLDARDLFLNEAALTGESFPAEKSVCTLPESTSLGNRRNSLYLGTHVISGIGSAVVVNIGRDTEFGKISERLEHKPPETGFERGLRQFGTLLIKIVVVITVVVFAIKVGLENRPIAESLLVTLALAVGMTPQLLPAVTSIVLAAGAKAMARHQVIVKQLISIENLGSMTVLCSDKTGTLTEGIIQLKETLDVSGDHSDRVARFAALNAHFQTGFTNPIDRAILDHSPIDSADITKLDEIPYDFVRKRLSVRVLTKGQRCLITKGALANVLDVCTTTETSSGELVELESRRDSIDALFSQMSNEGLRVLGVAIRAVDTPHIDKQDEQDMTFLGFLVLADPPKSDARQTLADLRQLGVGLKIITGDNRAVAATVSRWVGIESPVIVTGVEVRNWSTEALRHRAQAADVFAEVEPNQKERIIRALQESGAVVGYMGDGINDASALHAADVGISVASAVDVAREAAQIVLLKQDLSVLVHGVREGRRTFANTLKYIFYAIAASFGYMFSLAVVSLILPFEPLLASQILLVNLLADIPAMALATDNVDPEQIDRPRRWDIRFILRFMMSFGFASSMFDFLTFGAMYVAFGGAPEKLFQTGWFVESTLTGVMILLVVRTQRPFLLSRPGTMFMLAAALTAAITVSLPYAPFAATLGFVTPPARLMVIVIAITLLYGAGMEGVKRVFYRYLAH